MAQKKLEELKLTCLQVCNELKLTGLNRKIVTDKYKEKQDTLEEWKEELIKFGLDFIKR